MKSIKHFHQSLSNNRTFDLTHYREENILPHALDRERIDIKAKMTNQEQNQGATNDVNNYTKLLRDQMVKEADETCMVERKRDAAMQAILEKKDNDLKEKEDNRRRLVVEVQTSREAQINEKKRVEENRKAAEANEVNYNISVLEKQLLQEKLAKEEIKKRTIENMLWNKSKMEEKIVERERMKQEQLIQREIAEKEHQERLSKESDKGAWYR